jgi:hypothetical protein
MNVNWIQLARDKEPVPGSCEPGIKGEEYFDQLRDYQLLKKNCASWSYYYNY